VFALLLFGLPGVELLQLPVRSPMIGLFEGSSIALGKDRRLYCNFANSALACLRMGMSGSASFQRARKSW
jgi:hypothetical protein